MYTQLTRTTYYSTSHCTLDISVLWLSLVQNINLQQDLCSKDLDVFEIKSMLLFYTVCYYRLWLFH